MNEIGLAKRPNLQHPKRRVRAKRPSKLDAFGTDMPQHYKHELVDDQGRLIAVEEVWVGRGEWTGFVCKGDGPNSVHRKL